MKCPKCGSIDLKKIRCCGGIRWRCQRCQFLAREKDCERGYLPSEKPKEIDRYWRERGNKKEKEVKENEKENGR